MKYSFSSISQATTSTTLEVKPFLVSTEVALLIESAKKEQAGKYGKVTDPLKYPLKRKL